MKLTSVYLIIVCVFLNMNCSKEKKATKESITIGNRKQEKKVQEKSISSVPIMLENKGIGPIKSISFEDNINQDLADRGAKLFKSKCTACHKASQKFIGPPMAGIYKKRSPEWVINIIMNPDEMLKNDPVAKALLKEYNNTIMINQNIPEDEARAMAEWFRTL
ncbi:cytochrome c [Aquimarina sp. 2201CG5-10]|uniref:c-type cytochrome n=1 Tax=Aquimarina callyspongiae TaxID=3098150 RepID=UPI002AB35DA8|nr:cytochrome c [Aquimarina sp. 2201CG5-10]MDY8137998.1 cytochrome c [Aquimarina sp. 2201CG5-10]